MKTALLIYIALMLAIILVAAMPDGYRKGYMDGYRAAQVEQLPGIEIDTHKRMNPALQGKG